MNRIAILLTASLLLTTTATAHTAAPPRGHEVRLLHDCNDDYFGGDAFGGQTGHELHALDLFEAWDAGMDNIVVFRLTLAGEGPGTIELTLKAGSSNKNYQWTTQGSSWSGTFDKVEGPFQAKKADGTDDGDRFVLHGIVKQAKLGGNGAKLTDYSVQSFGDGEDADAMPGYDGSIAGRCTDEFQRPDYGLKGPIQYASISLEKASTTLNVDQEQFIQVTAANKLRDQAQRVTISATADAGVLVQMHDPNSNTYEDELSVDLNKKGGGGDAKIAHVAITGKEPGSQGSITIELTTPSGGRVVETMTFRVLEVADTPTPPAPTNEPRQPTPATEDNEAPGTGFIAILAALIAGVALRRP